MAMGCCSALTAGRTGLSEEGGGRFKWECGGGERPLVCECVLSLAPLSAKASLIQTHLGLEWVSGILMLLVSAL
jgi:hypothetical protein